MGRLGLSGIVAAIVLAACGEADKTSDPVAATPAGPPTFSNIIANPADYSGQSVEFKVSLASGKIMFPTGETAVATGQAWEDPPGTEHSVASPPDAPDDFCVFVVTNDEGTPVFPVQAIVTNNLSPCFAGSMAPVLTGKVLEAKDVSLIVDNQPATVRALTLSDLDFKAPF